LVSAHSTPTALMLGLPHFAQLRGARVRVVEDSPDAVDEDPAVRVNPVRVVWMGKGTSRNPDLGASNCFGINEGTDGRFEATF